jgi:hypothetical protein
MYYRCPARTLAPQSPVLAEHPPAVYVREDTIRDAVNTWLADLFDRDNVDRTAVALVASQDGAGERQDGRDTAKKRLAEAERQLRKFQAPIAAGVDPTAIVDAINSAQAERVAAQAEINNTPAPNLMDLAEVYARIDSLGDVTAKLNDAKGEGLAELYAGVDLGVLYEPQTSTAEISLRVNSVRVRGGTQTPVRGRSPDFREIDHVDQTSRQCDPPVKHGTAWAIPSRAVGSTCDADLDVRRCQMALDARLAEWGWLLRRGVCLGRQRRCLNRRVW